jgi:hypothetical protein
MSRTITERVEADRVSALGARTPRTSQHAARPRRRDSIVRGTVRGQAFSIAKGGEPATAIRFVAKQKLAPSWEAPPDASSRAVDRLTLSKSPGQRSAEALVPREPTPSLTDRDPPK